MIKVEVLKDGTVKVYVDCKSLNFMKILCRFYVRTFLHGNVCIYSLHRLREPQAACLMQKLLQTHILHIVVRIATAIYRK